MSGELHLEVVYESGFPQLVKINGVKVPATGLTIDFREYEDECKVIIEFFSKNVTIKAFGLGDITEGQ